MKVWITKYALTRGIGEHDVELDEDGNARLCVLGVNYFFRAADVHRSHESARRRALDMRDSKIKSLKRQIARLSSLEFKP